MRKVRTYLIGNVVYREQVASHCSLGRHESVQVCPSVALACAADAVRVDGTKVARVLLALQAYLTSGYQRAPEPLQCDHC